MKSNDLWKQLWKSGVTASSVNATAQQQALPSDSELDAFSYILISQSAYLKHHYLLEQSKTNNLWHIKD